MHLDKEKLNILISSSCFGQEELVKMEIIPSEKVMINVGLSKDEFYAYDRYCFEHMVKKSAVTRKLIRQGIKRKNQIIHMELPRIKERRNHCFLAEPEMKEQLVKCLKQINRESSLETPVKEPEFIRRCIVMLLNEQEDAG